MRNAEEYYSDLKRMEKNLYIGGEKVGRDDSRLMPSIRVIQKTFELAHDPDWHGFITTKSSLTKKEVNRFNHLPTDPWDLMQKQKMIRLLSVRTGGCIQRCMGQDAIVALSIATKEIDEKYGTEYFKRFMNFLKEYQERDLAGTCAQTDSKGDRSKRPHEQEDPDAYVHVVEENKDGIVVRGAKISITMAAIADEIIVIPTRALIEKDRDYAVAFAVPADWEGIKIITRPVWLRERKKFKCPYAEGGVSESIIIFNNTFIPWERVFMCGEWKYGRRLALLFADSHRFSYTGCKPAVSDILCGIAALVAEANNIEKTSRVAAKLSEYIGMGELAYAAGIAAALHGMKSSSGTFFPNVIYSNIGRRLMGENIYREFNILTDIAGGLSVTLPFEEDFLADETKTDLQKYIKRNPKMSYENAHRCWRLVENIAASPMTTWNQIAGVHGGGSPIMETITLNNEVNYEAKKDIAKYLSGIIDNLDQSNEINSKPFSLIPR